MSILKAGELTDRIQFESKSTVTLPNGDKSVTWTPILTTWAKVREKSGGYSLETGKVNSQSRIKIEMRYRPDVPVTVGNRVTWRRMSWILENSPVVDAQRTQISMDAILDVDSSQRTLEST